MKACTTSTRNSTISKAAIITTLFGRRPTLSCLTALPPRPAAWTRATWIGSFLILAMFGHSLASERPEREVEVRIGGGQCWPKGEWRDVMSAAGSGFGETLDVLLAVSVAPQVSVGVEFAFQRFGLTREYLDEIVGESSARPTTVGDWVRYTGSLRVAYVYSADRSRLFAAGLVGMHGMVNWNEYPDVGRVGHGDYALGLGAEIGWQLRWGRRLGTHLGARAEIAPGIEPEGAFVSVRAGMSVFL